MRDNNYLKKCQQFGTKFYINKKLNLILSEIEEGKCYILKCFSEDCKFQSTQYCKGNVEENYNNSHLELITQSQFTIIWENSPETKIDEQRFKCPNCKN